MKIKITKVIKWYEYEDKGTTYDVRIVKTQNINNLPVEDITIFHGSKPVFDWHLLRGFKAALILHEGM